MQTLTLAPGESRGVNFNPTDANGNPGTVATPPVWSSEDTAVAVINGVRSDGLRATITAKNNPGAQTLIDVVEANPGGFTDKFQVIVSELPATGGNFTFDPPA